MTEDEFMERIGEILYAELQEWQVDVQVDILSQGECNLPLVV